MQFPAEQVLLLSRDGPKFTVMPQQEVVYEGSVLIALWVGGVYGWYMYARARSTLHVVLFTTVVKLICITINIDD